MSLPARTSALGTGETPSSPALALANSPTLVLCSGLDYLFYSPLSDPNAGQNTVVVADARMPRSLVEHLRSQALDAQHPPAVIPVFAKGTTAQEFTSAAISAFMCEGNPFADDPFASPNVVVFHPNILATFHLGDLIDGLAAAAESINNAGGNCLPFVAFPNSQIAQAPEGALGAIRQIQGFKLCTLLQFPFIDLKIKKPPMQSKPKAPIALRPFNIAPIMEIIECWKKASMFVVAELNPAATTQPAAGIGNASLSDNVVILPGRPIERPIEPPTGPPLVTPPFPTAALAS